MNSDDIYMFHLRQIGLSLVVLFAVYNKREKKNIKFIFLSYLHSGKSTPSVIKIFFLFPHRVRILFCTFQFKICKK